jgi:hypothetical protein
MHGMSIHRSSTSVALAALLAGVLWPMPGRAYLGGFEEQDGYRIPSTGDITSLGFSGDAQFYLGNNVANGFTGVVPRGAFPNTMNDIVHGADLSRYNAGQYGTNAGGPGGTATDLADNSGSWKALAGGRLHEDIGAPFYQGNTFTRDYVAAYGYPNSFSGNQVLNVLASDVSLRYSYQFDSRDFDGISPTLTSDYLVTTSFWNCPSQNDEDVLSNVLGMTFKDSVGNSLVEIGYTGDNFLQYRIGTESNWQTTAVNLGAHGWSQITVTIDTYGNKVSLAAKAFNDLTSTLGSTTTVFTDEVLGFDTANVTDLEINAVAVPGATSKNFFDDFNVTLAPVPEPGSAVMVLLAGLWMTRRRRAI